MKNKIFTTFTIITLYIIVIIFLLITNIFFKNKIPTFFHTDLIDIASLITSLMIGIYFINSQSRYGKLLNRYEILVIEFQKLFINGISTNMNKKELLMHLKLVRNKFNNIYRYSSHINSNNILDRIEFIATNLKEYDDIIANNLENINDVIDNLNRTAQIINIACDDILVNMYI